MTQNKPDVPLSRPQKADTNVPQIPRSRPRTTKTANSEIEPASSMNNRSPTDGSLVHLQHIENSDSITPSIPLSRPKVSRKSTESSIPDVATTVTSTHDISTPIHEYEQVDANNVESETISPLETVQKEEEKENLNALHEPITESEQKENFTSLIDASNLEKDEEEQEEETKEEVEQIGEKELKQSKTIEISECGNAPDFDLSEVVEPKPEDTASQLQITNEGSKLDEIKQPEINVKEAEAIVDDECIESNVEVTESISKPMENLTGNKLQPHHDAKKALNDLDSLEHEIQLASEDLSKMTTDDFVCNDTSTNPENKNIGQEPESNIPLETSEDTSTIQHTISDSNQLYKDGLKLDDTNVIDANFQKKPPSIPIRRPSSKSLESSTNENSTNIVQKKPPPRVPKKPSSKIAQFQEMLEQQQKADMGLFANKPKPKPKLPTKRPSVYTETKDEISVVEKDNVDTDIPKISKLNAKFAQNLNGMIGMALPGMTFGGNPFASTNSVKNVNFSEDSDINKHDGGEDTEVIQEKKVKDVRRGRAKGPKGRKLPGEVSKKVEVNDVTLGNKFTIVVKDMWSFDFDAPVQGKENEDENETGIEPEKYNDIEDIEDFEHITKEEVNSDMESASETPKVVVDELQEHTTVDELLKPEKIEDATKMPESDLKLANVSSEYISAEEENNLEKDKDILDGEILQLNSSDITEDSKSHDDISCSALTKESVLTANQNSESETVDGSDYESENDNTESAENVENVENSELNKNV